MNRTSPFSSWKILNLTFITRLDKVIFYLCSMNNKIGFLLLFSLLLMACSENNSSPDKTLPGSDRAVQLFNEAQAVEDVDEKLRLLSKASKEITSPEDTLLTNILDFQIYYHDVNKAYDSAIYYANVMIKNAENLGDTAVIAHGYYRRARSSLYKEKHLDVLNDMYQAQRYYLLAGDSVSAGKRLVELGIAQKRLGDLPESQNSQIRALSLLKNSGDSIYLSRIYNNLAITYRQLKDPDEAIDEYSNALKFAISRKDSLSIFNNIANAYLEKKDYSQSLKILDSILPFALEKGTINRIKDNYYFALWLDHKANVEDSLKAVFQSRREENDLSGLLSSQNHLTVVNLKNDPGEALSFARDYYQTAQQLNNLSEEMEALNFLIRLAPPMENKKYAIEYLHLSDSLLHARDRVKNLFAKIKYDEEQKLEEIAGLEKLTINQRLELLQERNRRNFAGLLGLLLLAAALFLYYYLMQRHRKDTVRKIHATEARISKRLHDELANDIYNVMTQMENPVASHKESVLSKLESIYFRTRNISRENTPVDTGPGYGEELHYMLSHSTSPQSRLFLTGFQDINWEKINSEAKIIIYRSLQELMINMKKHSKASIIGLNFKMTGSKIHITYSDNGIGFSPEDFKKGSGLQNVENRIVSIAGAFNFHSAKEKGFSANILIPV